METTRALGEGHILDRETPARRWRARGEMVTVYAQRRPARADHGPHPRRRKRGRPGGRGIPAETARSLRGSAAFKRWRCLRAVQGSRRRPRSPAPAAWYEKPEGTDDEGLLATNPVAGGYGRLASAASDAAAQSSSLLGDPASRRPLGLADVSPFYQPPNMPRQIKLHDLVTVLVEQKSERSAKATSIAARRRKAA